LQDTISQTSHSQSSPARQAKSPHAQSSNAQSSDTKSSNAKSLRDKPGAGERKRLNNFNRRLKAAGLDTAEPEHIDDVRNQVTRWAYMLINEWRGCPEMLCRRSRGCMAPNIVCSNVEPLTATREEQQLAVAEFMAFIRTYIEEVEAEQEAAAASGTTPARRAG
jgi:hypothetical protein